MSLPESSLCQRIGLTMSVGAAQKKLSSHPGGKTRRMEPAGWQASTAVPSLRIEAFPSFSTNYKLPSPRGEMPLAWLPEDHVRLRGAL